MLFPRNLRDANHQMGPYGLCLENGSPWDAYIFLFLHRGYGSLREVMPSRKLAGLK